MAIIIIDYGMGNLASVKRSLEVSGAEAVISDNPDDLKTASGILLPGVGAFADGMAHLNAKNWPQAIKEEAQNNIPILGICLGMQLLADVGEEGTSTQGLGLISGRVVKFQQTALNEKIPHVGWNEVSQKVEHPLFKNIASGKDFYFVHSYYFKPAQPENILATTPYCGEFASSLVNENIMGVQFHPEKSQVVGLQLLKNFIELC